MVLQEPALLRGTVRHNVGWGLRAHGIRGAELRERTDQALDLLQLVDLADRRHDALSGGERKRTALAAAVAVRPQMLLLDEPLSSTHPALRRSLREQILAINRTLGTTILVATHDVQDALALASDLDRHGPGPGRPGRTGGRGPAAAELPLHRGVRRQRQPAAGHRQRAGPRAGWAGW